MTETALHARDIVVEVRRNGRWLRAVDGVSVSLQRGEVLGIVGETGAGKTLTSKAIIGLPPAGTRIAGGTARLGDADEAELSDPGAMQHYLGTEIGVVLQNPASMFDPLMRVGRQIVEAVVTHKRMSRLAATSRALELLAALGFGDPERVMGLHPHQLSGGMGQRAAIAMTLMSRPTLLVVDEPTSALDPHLRAEVLQVIAELARREQTAVLLISHDLALVSQYCDRVAVLYAGRVVETGSAAEVLGAPEHPYTQRLLASTTTMSSPARTPLAIVTGAPPQPGAWPEGCTFEPRCPLAFERCRTERPQLAGGESHRAACHLAFGGEAKLVGEVGHAGA